MGMAIATDAFTVDWSNLTCQPSMEPDRQSPVVYNQPGATRTNSSGTSLENTALIPTIITETGQSTTTHTSLTRGSPTSHLPDIIPQLAMWVISLKWRAEPLKLMTS